MARGTPAERAGADRVAGAVLGRRRSHVRRWPRDGQEDEARAQIRLSLQARQAALSTAVARLLVENNAARRRDGRQVQAIYDQVQRQVYWFLGATLAGDRGDGPVS